LNNLAETDSGRYVCLMGKAVLAGQIENIALPVMCSCAGFHLWIGGDIAHSGKGF